MLCPKIKSLSVLLKLVRVLAFMHIYSDISYFVQSIVMNDYHNVIAISREYADVTSESLLQVHIGPLSSMKNKTFIQILNGE